MNYSRKRDLVNTTKELTFEGIPCKVGGWANDYATITARFPGFYMASWETVERVVNGNKNFVVEDLTLTSMNWHGDGLEFPEKVRTYFRIPYVNSEIPFLGPIIFADGEPCLHLGCRSHISHPCEGCGRTGARGVVRQVTKTL
jgi:hypothetical protein